MDQLLAPEPAPELSELTPAGWLGIGEGGPADDLGIPLDQLASEEIDITADDDDEDQDDDLFDDDGDDDDGEEILDGASSNGTAAFNEMNGAGSNDSEPEGLGGLVNSDAPGASDVPGFEGQDPLDLLRSLASEAEDLPRPGGEEDGTENGSYQTGDGAKD
jgi:hypothetical protein